MAKQQRVGRRRLLRSAAAGGLGLAGAGLLACSGQSGRPNSAARSTPPEALGRPQAGGTYAFYLQMSPPLDPMQSNSVGTNRIAGAVMSRLFRFKTGLDPSVINNHDTESDLALSAETPDALTWTFKLRPGAKFHDVPPVNGRPVDAEDIKATFQRALGLPQNANRGALDMIDSSQIQSPSPDTVVFKLTYPYAPFSKTTSSPDASWIFPREALAGAHDPAKQAIGSGPFLLASATPDVGYTFRRNPTWFETGRPYLDSFNRPVILDRAQQYAQFTAGHLDEVLPDSNDLETMQRTNPKATVIKMLPGAALTGLIYLALGDPGSVFQDIRVRRALSMAIDRDALGKALFNNQYTSSLITPPSQGKWSLPLSALDAPTQQYYRYNPTEAKKLLQAAGILDRTFRFAYVTNGGFAVFDWYKQAALALRNMFASAGLKLEPVALDNAKDYFGGGKGYAQGNYPKDTILFAPDLPYTEVDQVVFADFDSNSTASKSQLKDAKLDAMIASARTLVDESERLKAYADIQKYVAQQVYVIPTVGQYAFKMIQPRVQNYQPGSQTGEAVETYSKVWLKQ